MKGAFGDRVPAKVNAAIRRLLFLFPFAVAPAAHAGKFSDFNNDGRSDILWRNAATGENYIYPMSGTAVGAGEGYLRTVADTGWQIAGIGDFNGDGKADILWRNDATGENYLYFMNGTAIAAEGTLRTVTDRHWQVAGVGDFDGDGRSDILWRNGATGENYVYLMNGTTIAGEGYLRTVADLEWQVAGVDDFNGDGRSDVLWRNGATGENYVYLMDGTAIAGEGYLRTVASLAWKITGTGDFTGDGKADILWRNSSTGENYLYPMDGTAILAGEGYLRTVADTNWRVQATGDYDGDAKADILWRHARTGDNYVYLMDGTAIKPGEGYTRTVGDQRWRVALRGGACGDASGPGGSDMPCFCGDTVVTHTVLDADPVTTTACTAGGLTLAAGVQLDLTGKTLTGNDTSSGLVTAHGGAVQGGTLQGFRTGVRIAAETPAINLSLTNVRLASNAAHGAVIDVRDSASRVSFDDATLEQNGAAGLHVRAAPGAANLDDDTQRLDVSGYGLRVSGSAIVNNATAGIQLGEAAAQPADVAALIGGGTGNTITGNLGAGIVMEQRATLAPGADCGASANQPGCTGATIAGNTIMDNQGPGVELRAGFIIPLYIPLAVDLGLGFVSNDIAHNGMTSAGCTAPQTQPQILVSGTVGLGNAACAAAQSEQQCNALGSRHCAWTNTSCQVAWDLRGDTTNNCNNGLLNAMYDYNTSDTGNFSSVGLRAINNAVVWADNNVWRSSDITQNYTQAPGSFVRGNLICSTRGTCLH